ncbi:alpha/beta hydrolase [Pseudooceanicola sp. C21-150M6]|uniref:alpha/beta hydrolase n=1 Tax=Pseudooceanicola sp. C21-150M6 TaxID=3434355 RepID=UPI003D7FA4EC
MTPAELIATLSALIAHEPDTSAFSGLMTGGHDPVAKVEIQTCPRPLDPAEIEGETLICGVVTVPEDHETPDGPNTVDLEFVLLKAESLYPNPDPLLYLHGGPGGGNLPGGALWLSENFAPFRDTRDVIAFDQRGAGISSDSVECAGVLTDSLDLVLKDGAGIVEVDGEGGYRPTQLLLDCVAELEASGRDLSKYNTRQNALDAQMVMRALGYDEWNIFGASYGTKLTLEIMRTAPEGLRAAVLDGVAPPIVHLYDTLALPRSESLERLVSYCAAEEACNAAYPDLGQVILDVHARAGRGEVLWQDKPFPQDQVEVLVDQLSAPGLHAPLTPYLPAIFYELYRGKETPTVDLVYGEWDMWPPSTAERDMRAAAEAALDDAGIALVDEALTSARIAGDAEGIMQDAVTQLRETIRRDRDLGPLAALLDAEMTDALPEMAKAGADLRALLRDYAALRQGTPDAGRLATFVTDHFDGSRQARLLAIVGAMTEAEITAFFEGVYLSVEPHSYKAFQKGFDNALYYCQEDMPYNTPEQYAATTAALPYSFHSDWDDLAARMFAQCRAFKQSPRDGFHEVVVSDIPTLSIGSAWDQNTAGSWAALATEGLSNAQSVMIQEAGHIALRFQPCVADMAHAFFDNPGRKLGDACEREAAVPPFHIADWARP